LIEEAIPTAPLGASSSAPTISTDDLGAIFDIEIGDAPVAKSETTITAKPAAKRALKKPRVTKKAIATKTDTTTRERPAAEQAVKKTRAEKKATATKKKAKPVLKKV